MTSGSVSYAEIDRRGDGKSDATPSVTQPPSSKSHAVVYSCSVDGNTVNSHTFLPGAATLTPVVGVALQDIYAHVRQEAGAASDAPVQCSHVRRVPSPPPPPDHSEWLSRRMAPNCAPHYNPSQVTSFNKFTCRYNGTGKVVGSDGKTYTVSNPYKEWTGTLPSCDSYGSTDGAQGMEISDEVMHAIKVAAYDAAGGKEAELDVDQFVCQVQSLPMI